MPKRDVSQSVLASIELAPWAFYGRAKKAGLIAAIKPYTVQLQNSGIYMSQNLIDAVLLDIGE